MKMINGCPRRSNLQHMTAEEKAIYELAGTIEELGAHPLLTDVTSLLADARSRLADWVDQQPQRTLEDLLNMTVIIHDLPVPVEVPPQFLVKVQEKGTFGTRIIIHADGHNSDTLDFWVRGNTLEPVVTAQTPATEDERA